MTQLLAQLSGFAPYLVLCGFVLTLIAFIYESFTVFEWRPSAFFGRFEFLRVVAPCVYATGYETEVCESLASYFKRADIPAEAHSSDSAVVFIRTRKFSRYGFLRGRVEFGEGSATVHFSFSVVSFFHYVVLLGFAALEPMASIGTAIVSAGALFWIYLDQKIIRARAESISRFLLTKFECKENFD